MSIRQDEGWELEPGTSLRQGPWALCLAAPLMLKTGQRYSPGSLDHEGEHS